MAYKNPDTTTLYLNTDLALGDDGGCMWIIGKCTLSAGTVIATTDVIDLFGEAAVRGYAVMDWWVAIPQVDMATTASAMVAFNVGVAGDATGISGTTGLRWTTSATVGHVVGGSLLRATNINHLNQNGHNNRIGLSVSQVPHDPDWGDKTFTMGLLIRPVID